MEKDLFEPTPPRTPDEHRVVAFYNPCSTRAHKIEREGIEPLKSEWGNVITVESCHPDDGNNALMLAEQLRSGDIVVSLTGDGTANDVAAGVDLARREGIDSYVVFAPFGYANDTSLSVHGGLNIIRKRLLLPVIEHGYVEQMPVIGITETNDNGDNTKRIAVGYASLHAAAHASERINEAKRNWGSFVPNALRNTVKDLRSARIIRQTIKTSRPFTYEQYDEEQNARRTHKAQSYSLHNIRRMAKHLRFDVDTFANEMTVVEMVSEEHLMREFVARIIKQRPYLNGGGGIQGKTSVREELTVLSNTSMQRDGEVTPIPHGTRLTFAIQDKALNVLTAV